ncbi:Acetyltransferase (GNAT) domain-containing protein [Desulfonatronum thiosulfatophilum]|uniref:Acetyltransferase (GNAT) domain-containing protein n=1 Tax=Desulfonatronum thiosulfatophilum TaxID=617002 RepID=A0A1G6EKP3_9BACT|nr:GNAT family N-acetyltransferase [Desulfonatronum thiosulfatophilum]SDB58073.1 Acetyltransferase (GNAT) domain-containing protein [Desulfonatronum thiosulfatophilum]
MRFMGAAGVALRHFRQSAYTRYGAGFPGICKFLYYSLFRVNTFIVFSCGRGETSKPDMPVELRIVRGDHHQLGLVRGRYALPGEFYCDLSHNVHDYFMGLWNEFPAYVHWIFPPGKASRFLELGPGCAEVNYMLTLPDYRGRHLCSLILACTIHELMAENVQRIYCVVHDANIASIKAVQRSGFQEMQRVRSIGPFNFRIKVDAA